MNMHLFTNLNNRLNRTVLLNVDIIRELDSCEVDMIRELDGCDNEHILFSAYK